MKGLHQSRERGDKQNHIFPWLETQVGLFHDNELRNHNLEILKRNEYLLKALTLKIDGYHFYWLKKDDRFGYEAITFTRDENDGAIKLTPRDFTPESSTDGAYCIFVKKMEVGDE